MGLTHVAPMMLQAVNFFANSLRSCSHQGLGTATAQHTYWNAVQYTFKFTLSRVTCVNL